MRRRRTTVPFVYSSRCSSMAVLIRWTAYSLSSLVCFPPTNASLRLNLPRGSFSGFAGRRPFATSPIHQESGIEIVNAFLLIKLSSYFLFAYRVSGFRRSCELQSYVEGDGFSRIRSKFTFTSFLMFIIFVFALLCVIYDFFFFTRFPIASFDF